MYMHICFHIWFQKLIIRLINFDGQFKVLLENCICSNLSKFPPKK